MVKEGDDFADKAGGGFKETAVKRDRSILVHTACCAAAKVVLHVFGGLPDEVDVFEVAGKRGLFG